MTPSDARRWLRYRFWGVASRLHQRWRRLVLWPRPARKRALWNEICAHVAFVGRRKMPLWRCWEVQRLHRQLGHVWDLARLTSGSPAEYRQRLKWERQVAAELLAEIVAEERARLLAEDRCPKCRRKLRLATDTCPDQHVTICSYYVCDVCRESYEPPGVEDGARS